MYRRASALLRLLSLLLCAAACALWVRSYWWEDAAVRVRADGRYQQLSSEMGFIRWRSAPNCPWTPGSWEWIAARRYNGTHGIVGPGQTWVPAVASSPTGWPVVVTDVAGPTRWEESWAVPHAVAVAGAALLPLAGLFGSARRRTPGRGDRR